MPDYNPFDKPLREVQLQDLDRLSQNNVSEGTYVEFKRSLPDPQKISKVIASFANTHGGYFIIGVAEDDVTNIASGKIGINTNETSSPNDHIRTIVRDHLDPSPNFSSRVIQREDYTDYVIVIVEVPESHDAPHIHSSGKVYTRTGEGSDPISPETDRWTLDRLYQRRNEWNQRIEDFCTSDITLTQGQAGESDSQPDGWPFIEIYGIPSTLDDPICDEVLDDVSGFRSILENSELVLPGDSKNSDGENPMSGGHMYDAYRSSSEAVVAQNWGVEQETGKLATAHAPNTFKFFADGGLKYINAVPQFNTSQRQHQVWNTLKDQTDQNLDYIRFLDGEDLLLTTYMALNSYLNLLEKYNWMEDPTRELLLKARIRHGNRTIMMFETEWFLDLLDEFGPIISYEDTVEIPRTTSWEFSYSDKSRQFIQLMEFLLTIIEGFGISWQYRGKIAEELWDRIFDILRDQQELDGTER